ncbi:hypothetical protein OG589_31055 [Sphaerisporangium sp. NBC_01403]|uniref:hypothetical protein n=1 Tax=Sphaerisporangium sp. NBC_01403 TaxID=2903599 RepID=UPI0032562A56
MERPIETVNEMVAAMPRAITLHKIPHHKKFVQPAQDTETVLNAVNRETVRRSVETEMAWQRAVRQMRARGLSRVELDDAARVLGRLPLTDDEWAEIDEAR